MTLREQYINAITDHAVRAWVYAEARRRLPNIGARCAMTQYLFLWRSGAIKAISPAPTFTSQLEMILLTQDRWNRVLLKNDQPVIVKRITDATQLQRGDICFSQNRNATPGPDHVYAYHSPLPEFPGYAMIVDNYCVDQHKRNITAAGPKTPFDFALRLPG